MVIEEVRPAPGRSATDCAIDRLRAELARRFTAGSACVARADDFALLIPGSAPEHVEEALHRLVDDGRAEMFSLADGSLAFHFPPR